MFPLVRYFEQVSPHLLSLGLDPCRSQWQRQQQIDQQSLTESVDQLLGAIWRIIDLLIVGTCIARLSITSISPLLAPMRCTPSRFCHSASMQRLSFLCSVQYDVTKMHCRVYRVLSKLPFMCYLCVVRPASSFENTFFAKLGIKSIHTKLLEIPFCALLTSAAHSSATVSLTRT